MRNNSLGWFPKANKSKFSFAEKGVSRGGKRIFPSGMPKNTSMNNDLGISPSFPSQLQSSAKQTYPFPKSNGVVNSEVTIYPKGLRPLETPATEDVKNLRGGRGVEAPRTVVRFRDVFKNQ